MNKIPKIEEIFTEEDKEFNRKMVELGQNFRKNETNNCGENEDYISEILDDFSKNGEYNSLKLRKRRMIWASILFGAFSLIIKK